MKHPQSAEQEAHICIQVAHARCDTGVECAVAMISLLVYIFGLYEVGFILLNKSRERERACIEGTGEQAQAQWMAFYVLAQFPCLYPIPLSRLLWRVLLK